MKLTTIMFLIGCSLLFAPWYLLDKPAFGSVLISLIGFFFLALVGYNAQASMVGQGEPGEDLLQKAWHWFRVKVLRQKVVLLPSPEPMDAHQSIVPKPPLSLLSKSVQGIGLVLIIAPTLLGWKVGNDWRMGFLAVGSVLIVLARRTLPPQSPSDPPHGKELLQVAWAWVQQRLKGKL